MIYRSGGPTSTSLGTTSRHGANTPARQARRPPSPAKWHPVENRELEHPTLNLLPFSRPGRRRPRSTDTAVTAVTSPWQRPAFRWFFTGQTISLLGNSMKPVALAFAVLEASGRSFDLGLVLAANSVPLLVFLLVGGAVADRISRSVLLVVAHLGTALTQAAVAILLISDNYHLGVIVALEACNGTFMAFTMPAVRGILPQLVDRSELQRANAARATSRNAAKILGPTAAGVFVVTVGGGWAIGITAVSLLIAAVCMARLKLPSSTPAEARAGLLMDIRDGWTQFRSLPWAVVVVTAFALTNFILAGVWTVLGPIIARDTIGEAGWGAVLSARAIGLLVMGVIMYRLIVTHMLRLGQACAAMFAVPLVLLGLDLPVLWLIGAAFLAGLGSTVAGVTWETSLQEHVRPQSLSRVTSYDDLGSFIAVPLGQLTVIPIAAAFGEHQVAIAGGLLYGTIALAALAFPSVRSLKHGEQ